MTIKSLYDLLKTKCPQIFRLMPISIFRGKKIAIDSQLFIFSAMSNAHRRAVNETDVAILEPNRGTVLKYWLTGALDFICCLLSYGITPIFVFDGKSLPEKEETRAERRKQREKDYNELNRIKDELEKLDMLARPPTLIIKYRKILSRCFKIAEEDINLFKNIITTVGIPVLHAKHDAEQLCAFMCKEGYVSAVYSSDGDNIAMGCPLLITDFTGKKILNEKQERVHEIKLVVFADILDALKLTDKEFLDLCILLGCDFNSNVPFIGMVSAYQLISSFKSIDKLPRTSFNMDLLQADKCPCKLSKKREYDLRILRHTRCREIFQPGTSYDLCLDQEFVQKLSLRKTLGDEARDMLNSYQLINSLSKLVEFYNIFPDENKTEITLPLLEAPKVDDVPIKCLSDPQTEEIIVKEKPKPKVRANKVTKTVVKVTSHSEPALTKEDQISALLSIPKKTRNFILPALPEKTISLPILSNNETSSTPELLNNDAISVVPETPIVNETSKLVDENLVASALQNMTISEKNTKSVKLQLAEVPQIRKSRLNIIGKVKVDTILSL